MDGHRAFAESARALAGARHVRRAARRSSRSSSSIRSRRSSSAASARRAAIPPLDVLTDPVTREVVWFTVWQALASTALTFVVALPAAYVLGRYRFRGRSVVERARRRSVRAADGRRRARVPRDPAGRTRPRAGRRSSSRTRSSTSRSSSASSARSGRASIRAIVGGRRDARRGPAAALPGDHVAAPRPLARGSGRDRLPLLVHVVRDRPHPRRAALRDARGGDLQPGRAPLRPARRGGPLARPARVRGRSQSWWRCGWSDDCRAAGGCAPSATCCGGRAPRARRCSSAEASARSLSSSDFRSPSSSSARSQSAAGTASTPIGRSPTRRRRSSSRRGRRS